MENYYPEKALALISYQFHLSSDLKTINDNAKILNFSIQSFLNPQKLSRLDKFYKAYKA